MAVNNRVTLDNMIITLKTSVTLKSQIRREY